MPRTPIDITVADLSGQLAGEQRPLLRERLQHPEVGVMTVQCQLLHDHEQGQSLLVYMATSGTELDVVRLEATDLARKIRRN